MFLRVPFFGLLSSHSPLRQLLDHYDKISDGVKLMEESLECYIGGEGHCKAFEDLTREVDVLEDQADKIKRSIRNHLPRGLFLPVDRTVFFDYTRRQDNILDEGQKALNVLFVRPLAIPLEFHKEMLEFVGEVTETVKLLRPALESTVELLHGKHYDRAVTKNLIRTVRTSHKVVFKRYHSITSHIYNAEVGFKDFHQLLEFVEEMYSVSHNTEGCADLLRAMIAK
ncbi:DUF47 domain-containing protein [Megalodesulfovibrio gigas]|uniref:Putative phosphate transport regulator n=1 Tax=Megalodesulfovibrio gigas (strain ATCC 19364 / DSM 1382 / NCIMB 9332 / VKM B-1759) TaxID=1121448 RepID=T2GCQ0_MEGG1|nr:DUF47 family protein [Megalodesulfovibrio gigas]AGW13906.1 putative phosphate transport regulator [Megalodesulfovibrio gigas DSM 1382 = ATCC 19364]